ncbi:MAG: DUF6029 family protein [bacterium]
MELSQDEITQMSKFEGELELRGRFDRFSSFVRMTSDKPFAFQREDFKIDKRGLRYELNDDWDVSLGDYAVVFGRGLSLNAVEQRAVDRDAMLDGGKVDGGIGPVDLIAFWGQHKSVSPDFYVGGVNTLKGDKADELYGGRLTYDLDDTDLGISYIRTKFSNEDSFDPKNVIESDLSWEKGNISLYCETAWFNRDEPEGEVESLDGTGTLAEIQYAEGGFSILASWVRYERAFFNYAVAPSLKRFEVDHSDADPEDETGYKFDLTYSPPAWGGHSVHALYTDLNGIESKNKKFENIFIEYSTPAVWEWSGTVSYDKIMGLLPFYGAVYGVDHNFRMNLDGPSPIGESFHLYGRYRLLANRYNYDDESQIGLDFHISPEFTMSFFREISTRLTEPPPPGMFFISSKSPKKWNSMSVRWAPDSWSQFEFFIGSQRGGFQCSGGVCAQLPPFKGTRFTYYRSF